MAVNCAAIPADLLESELFGHERAPSPARTRATSATPSGQASGTLFLDEIGDSLDAPGEAAAPARGPPSTGSAARSPCLSRPASSARPTPISRSGRARGRSARTCSTGSTSLPSRSRRCASGRTMSRGCSTVFFRAMQCRRDAASAASARSPRNGAAHRLARQCARAAQPGRAGGGARAGAGSCRAICSRNAATCRWPTTRFPSSPTSATRPSGGRSSARWADRRPDRQERRAPRHLAHDAVGEDAPPRHRRRRAR